MMGLNKNEVVKTCKLCMWLCELCK